METRHRTHYQHRPLSWLRDLALSGLLGAGIGFTLWMGDPDTPLAPQLAVAAVVGLCIYGVANLLLFLFDRPLAHLDGWRHRLAMTGIFFLGGVGGWLLAVGVVPLVSGGAWHMGPGGTGWLRGLAFVGVLGVSIGLAFYSYEMLKLRLAESIDRIREQEYAERELEAARELQQRLLPPATVEGAGFRVTGRNLPARYVGGDFWDLVRSDDGSLLLVVADVVGKGLAASLVTASVKTMLTFVAPGRRTEEVLRELNRNLHRDLGAREFVALCLVRYEPATGAFEVANAGLPDPYRLGTAPVAVSCPGPRLPLGLRPEVSYGSISGRLEPGERLLVVSDGLPEALTPDGDPLGYDRLEALVASTPLAVIGPAAEGEEDEPWLDRLLRSVEEATGPTRDDDWTALLLERTP